MTELQMKQKLQSAMTLERYIHTQGVAAEAIRLAKHYGLDEKQAALAGWLHDCAKDYPESLKRQFCKEFHIKLDEVMKKQIDLTHPFLGAEIAKREYGVTDEGVLDAIRYHTTGRAGMRDLEKLVYIADYIEPNRSPFPGLLEARTLAYENLDTAMKFILEHTLAYVKERGRTLHPLTLEALKDYQ